MKYPLIDYIDELMALKSVLGDVKIYECFGTQVIVCDIAPPNTVLFVTKDSYLEVKDVGE